MGGLLTSFGAADDSDISEELIEPEFTPEIRHGPERRVEIGLNVIAMHDIDDAHHSFQCNVLMHVSWVPINPNFKWAELRASRARPAKDPEPWFPWIQVHNLQEMVHMYSPEENKGMSKMTEERARKLISEYFSKGNFDEPMQPVLESTNFVAKFINTLDLHHFPFDSQKLRMTVVSNQTKDVTLTHKMVREPTYTEVPCEAGDGSKRIVKWKFPTMKNKPSIKCNLEGDTVSEWNILLHPKDPAEVKAEEAERDLKKKVVSNSDQAVCIYRFHEHDPKLSALGAIYQRLDVFVIAEREVRNFLWSVIAPTAALCFASLSVFAISIDESREGVGDRLGILFTIILAIIANSIATQDRLPKVDYFTWADYCLYWMQFLVYLVVVETSACIQLAEQFSMSVESLDSALFYSLIIIFGVSYATMTLSAFSLHYNRSLVANRYSQLGEESLQLEEERLFYWENGCKIKLATDGRTPDANTTQDHLGEVQVNLQNPI